MNKDLFKGEVVGTVLKDFVSGVCSYCGEEIEIFRLRDDQAVSYYLNYNLCIHCQDNLLGTGKTIIKMYDGTERTLEKDFLKISRGLVDLLYNCKETNHHYYHKKETPKALWVWADVPNSGDYIFVRRKSDEPSDGFGGSTLTFTTVDGEIIKLQGPWHSNADSLFVDTGVDLRDKYWSFYAIAKERIISQQGLVLVGLLDGTPVPKITFYEEAERRAHQIAINLRHPVALYHQSYGGSHNRMMNP
jgi:hypothetical protein